MPPSIQTSGTIHENQERRVICGQRYHKTLNSPTGVYFQRQDYAPFWLRVVVDLIDIVIYFAFVLGVLAIVAIVDATFTRTVLNLVFLTWVAGAVLYFVVLKR